MVRYQLTARQSHEPACDINTSSAQRDLQRRHAGTHERLPARLVLRFQTVSTGHKRREHNYWWNWKDSSGGVGLHRCCPRNR